MHGAERCDSCEAKSPFQDDRPGFFACQAHLEPFHCDSGLRSHNPSTPDLASIFRVVYR